MHVTSSTPPPPPPPKLWDVGGQQLGGAVDGGSSSMVAQYVYGCQALLLVYDVTNMKVRRMSQG